MGIIGNIYACMNIHVVHMHVATESGTYESIHIITAHYLPIVCSRVLQATLITCTFRRSILTVLWALPQLLPINLNTNDKCSSMDNFVS
jgi:hypothetical protein